MLVCTNYVFFVVGSMCLCVKVVYGYKYLCCLLDKYVMFFIGYWCKYICSGLDGYRVFFVCLIPCSNCFLNLNGPKTITALGAVMIITCTGTSRAQECQTGFIEVHILPCVTFITFFCAM